mmetsp:Transcript_154220/g.272252  ORF Transcript_154220/g.272252 Transcript_154220/m.272252 type:complete len:232 (+) Transcript_154220:1615-2310(+)
MLLDVVTHLPLQLLQEISERWAFGHLKEALQGPAVFHGRFLEVLQTSVEYAQNVCLRLDRVLPRVLGLDVQAVQPSQHLRMELLESQARYGLQDRRCDCALINACLLAHRNQLLLEVFDEPVLLRNQLLIFLHTSRVMLCGLVHDDFSNNPAIFAGVPLGHKTPPGLHCVLCQPRRAQAAPSSIPLYSLLAEQATAPLGIDRPFRKLFHQSASPDLLTPRWRAARTARRAC